MECEKVIIKETKKAENMISQLFWNAIEIATRLFTKGLNNVGEASN